METKAFYKLVRDRIPKIIEDAGGSCKTRILSDTEYRSMLHQKLSEELSEYLESQTLEELADLLEVLYATTRAGGWTIEDLERTRQKKREARGGFEEKILLLETEK